MSLSQILGFFLPPSSFLITFILMNNCIYSKHILQHPQHRLRDPLLHPAKDVPMISSLKLGLVSNMFSESALYISH